MSTTTRAYTIQPLATCTPPSASRAWQTSPQPHHPYIAVACADKTVRIYSLTSFTLLSTITGGHKRSVRTCAWKPSLPSEKPGQESILATGSFDASAAIWVGRPGQEVVDAGFGGWDYSDTVGAREDDDDDEDFRFAVVLDGHDSEIKSVAWSAHGTFLATCSRDKSVWLWEDLGDENYETMAVMQEHDGDVKVVRWHPSDEQCLASGSYDEMIRVWREDMDGEWGCVAVCEGHKGTVWCVEWEPWGTDTTVDGEGEVKVKGDDGNAESGPRIMSSSADATIKVWRRKPKAKPQQQSGPRIPSIIRSSDEEEQWFEEAQLPQAHIGAIYAVAWSKKSRRVASCGSDGKILVYEEVDDKPEDATMTDGSEQANGTALSNGDHPSSKKSWKILAEIDDAHGVFEVNHVVWANRFDRNRRSSDEEIIISTGDDGEVKVWTLDNI